ncbi:MAG: hypothetical protein JWO80_2308 [Bryobacterales bacterium]|nr:hypothetical protein [Bryobacterales bacterium]
MVTDASGAAIPDALIKAVNRATNVATTTKSQKDGLYQVPFLEPGVYDIEFTADGFQVLKRAGITLEVSQTLNLPAKMTLGQTSQQLTVVGDQEVIDTSNANRGLVFDPTTTQELPLNGRQSYMLLALTPGVMFTQEQFGASGYSGTRGWDVSGSYKFNGARAGNGNNAFLLNGSIISNESSTWLFAPSVEAIAEFNAITTAVDTQYGHEAGGVVNTIIKSGTNNWHGDGYDYFRNRVLDANSFQNNFAGQPKGRHNQNQFGGVVGGPIRKDKDFVFGSYEGWQEVVPFPAQGSTVPLDLRDGQGFANHQISIFDPLTTHACGSALEPCSQSAYWRSPFPNDVIPQSRISPVGQKILSYLPAPNGAGQGAGGITNNFVGSHNEGRYWYNQAIARYDHVFSDQDKFTAMYSYFHGYEYRSSNGFDQPVATGNTDNNRTFNGINLDETHIISPSMVLDFRGNFLRFTQLSPGYNTQAQKITPQSVGITNLIHAPTVTNAQIPNINIEGISGPLFGNGSITHQPYTSWDFTPNLSWSKGRHGLHFGFEFHYEARGNESLGNAYGTLTFGSGLTRQATDRNIQPTDTFGVASLLLGIPTAGSIDNNATSYVTRQYYAGYVQDDWKVSDRLTINMGARYEVQLPYLERYNRMDSAFDINALSPLSDQILATWNKAAAAYNATNPKNPYPAPPAAIKGAFTFAGVNGRPRRQFYTDWTNVAPRLGFAYRVGQKTVIRGGFGVFYQSMTQTGNSTTGFSSSTSYISSLDGGITPSACANGSCQNGVPTGAYSLLNPFPNGLNAVPGSSLGLLSNLGVGANGNTLEYKIPRTYQYNLGFERALPKNMVLDIAFAGNFAGMTTTAHDLGFPQDAAGLALQTASIADPSIYSAQLPNPFLGILPKTTSLGSATTVSRSSLLQAWPLWGGISDSNVSRATFRSDALQLRFQRKAFGGADSSLGVVSWTVAWTFSKEYALTCCAGPSYLNGDSNFRYALDSNNKTHELGINGVWDLPFGKGRKYGSGVQGIADKAVSDWRLDYIFNYTSGFPVALPNLINTCGRWDAGSAQNEFHWFNNNPACYSTFPNNAGALSYLPPRFSGNVNNPAKPQVSIAMSKFITFHDRYKVNFRAESFNISNTPIRPGPSTTFPSTTFGVLPESQQNFPRLVQLALKLYF